MPAAGSSVGARPLRGAELSQTAACAAAFGALWGAVEVTAGSFLHALRIPFSGVLLAALGAGLLVAQRQVCNRRGVTIMTGAVAALCKSLSPAGIIWNPMVAIAVEAALAEAVLAIAPRAALSAALAGALAVLWSIGQGLLMQFLLYGSRVFALYVTVVGKTSAWLGFPAASAWWSLAGILASFLALGGSAGLWGRRIGRLARQRLAREGDRIVE